LSSSSLDSSLPIAHSLKRDPSVVRRKSLAFVSNAVNRYDSATPRKEPQHAGIELAHVTQFKESVAKRFGQWLVVILPIPQLCESGKNRCEVIRIASLQPVYKLLHRTNPCSGLVELYREIHICGNIRFDVLRCFKELGPIQRCG
jgi:hypothetical protein